jgi:hypothetical protein
MRFPSAILAAATCAALAACGSADTENVQTKAENTSAALENEAGQIAAEAENGVDSVVDTLENQAAALDEQFDANSGAGADNSANATANAQ